MFKSLLRRIWFVAAVAAVCVLAAVGTAAAQIPPDPGKRGAPDIAPATSSGSSLSAWSWVLIGVGIVVVAAALVLLATSLVHRHREAAPLRPRMP